MEHTIVTDYARDHAAEIGAERFVRVQMTAPEMNEDQLTRLHQGLQQLVAAKEAEAAKEAAEKASAEKREEMQAHMKELSEQESSEHAAEVAAAEAMIDELTS